MYGHPNHPLRRLPPGFQPHNSLGRPQKPARVRVLLRCNPEDMRRRQELAEHPFGTVKWYDGAHYFLCRGKEKVSAEIALSFLAYNLRLAINLLAQALLSRTLTKETGKTGAKRPLLLLFQTIYVKNGQYKSLKTVVFRQIVVEVRESNPPSESMPTQFSPSASMVLGFPSPHAPWRACGYGSFIFTGSASKLWACSFPASMTPFA